jgi:hypothetical protein
MKNDSEWTVAMLARRLTQKAGESRFPKKVYSRIRNIYEPQVDLKPGGLSSRLLELQKHPTAAVALEISEVRKFKATDRTLQDDVSMFDCVSQKEHLHDVFKEIENEEGCKRTPSLICLCCGMDFN